jgi:putative ABC transport system permease protein
VSFWQHARFIQAYPTNFDKDNVIAVPLGKGADYPVLKNALAGVPGITAVAGCRTHLVYSGYRKVAEIDGEKREIRMNEVGDDYLQLMDVVLLEGRLFDRDRAADDARSVVVNETFLREMGLQGQPYLGKTIRVDTLAYSIGGVIKDVVNNFFDPLEPQVICRIAPEKSQYLVVKSTREQLPAVDAQLKSTWASLFPYRPYAGFYQSELIAEGLDVTNKIRKIFALFASVTILLTLTSLFALLSLHLQKRRKEVAIRRVLGASEGAIAVLLNRHFALILLLGIALGCAAGAALTQVLISGIFRINNGIEAGVLVFSSLGLLLLALLAAGIMWWQALRSNPAEVLRSE